MESFNRHRVFWLSGVLLFYYFSPSLSAEVTLSGWGILSINITHERM